jgi:hypothetical protein
MRILLFAAALSVSGIALAQETTEPAAAPDAVQTPVSPSGPGTDPNGPNNPPGDGVTQQGTDPNGSAVAPPGANEPLAVPPGAVVVSNPNQAAVFTPQQATTDYPACSKTVTDRCVQTYERGRRG